MIRICWWWWWWWFWLNASNIYILQHFSKKNFWQCWETYCCEYQIKKPEVVLSKVREFTFVVGWWWWWCCWWFWWNPCNIYTFQFFPKNPFPHSGETSHCNYQKKKSEVVVWKSLETNFWSSVKNDDLSRYFEEKILFR